MDCRALGRREDPRTGPATSADTDRAELAFALKPVDRRAIDAKVVRRLVDCEQGIDGLGRDIDWRVAMAHTRQRANGENPVPRKIRVKSERIDGRLDLVVKAAAALGWELEDLGFVNRSGAARANGQSLGEDL